MSVEDDLPRSIFFFRACLLGCVPSPPRLPSPGRLIRCSFSYNLRIRSEFMCLSEGFYDHCWQQSITISWSYDNSWYCCCYRNRCGSPQSIEGQNELLGYFPLSNEKESSRRSITPVALQLGHGHLSGWEGAGGRCCRCRHSADEADAGVKFLFITINESL